MQNSADNAAPAVKPAAKKQGFIRFEAIIPLAIIIGLIAVYFMLFFDTHLRHGLESVATQANGAEVNIGKLKTSVWSASVTVGDIAMTNPEMPDRNRVQIGAVNFQMLWDALLRGKVVINEASIINVQIDTPRKSPGRVLPVKVAEETKDSASGEGAGDKVLGQMKQEFSGNVIGDLAAIAAGADPKQQLGSVGTDIKSSAYIDGLQQSLDTKNQQWQSRIAAMPKGEDFAALQRRLANVKLDNLQDITQVQVSFKELESVRNDFDAKSKTVSETGSTLKDETGAFRTSFADLDKIVKEDVSNLQAKMHLPSLDTRSLSRGLFGMDILGKLQQTRGYMEQARSYMPAKNDKKKAIAPPKREKGHDYVFGKPNAYPAFWLRKALISSKFDGGESDLSGEIVDMSTNQEIVGRPMTAAIKGNLSQQGISGINALLIIDHTTSVPVERMVMEVGRYPVAGRSLVSSPSLELGFSRADSAMKFSAELREEKVDVRMNNQFNQVAFETRAESVVVREMINSSIAGLNAVNLNAHVTGTWSDLNWQISTDLADALSKGMQRYLQEKVNAARALVEKQVNDQIDAKRKQLFARQSEIESGLKSRMGESQAQVDKLRAELDGARTKLESRKNALLGAQQQKLKQGGEKALEGLRKMF